MTWMLTTYKLCSCHLCLYACNRSLLARGLSIDSRAYVISQHARWPVRAPLPTCANQDAWVVITPKRQRQILFTQPRGTPTRSIIKKVVFYLIQFPASFICLSPSCHSDLGDRGMLGAVPRTNRIPMTKVALRPHRGSHYSPLGASWLPFQSLVQFGLFL